jgi:hypothetical protein
MISSTNSKPHNLRFEYIELAGEKVRLRPTTADDAERAFKILYNNQEILKWLCWDGPPSDKEIADTYGIRWPLGMKEGTR